MIRACIAITAALLATPAASQSLTLGNLKAPIARASGKAPAKSIKDLWTQINGLPAARPPAPTPPPVTPTPAPRGGTIAEGDSISLQWAGSYTGLYLRDHPTGFAGKAVSGARINDPQGGNGLMQRLPALLAARPERVTVLIGANDLGDGQYPTPEAWLDALWVYTSAVRASGAKVYVGTVLPICLPVWTDYTSRHNTRRATVNSAIRGAVGARIDGVIDFAADATLGPDAAACDLSLYKDGIHPADAVQPRMMAIYAAALGKVPSEMPLIPAAIPSNFDRTAFISGGQPIPPSAAPDVVGAFRFICQPSHEAWADPIANPGGRSHALHQFFGNTLAGPNSTFASLRTTGDSTCMNRLNLSAYWMPGMLNGAGDVVRPDWISVYYKRLPASDPECKRMAAEGCDDLPNGLKLISGYDHNRMGQPQPENATFHWRCVTNQVARDNLTDALADCGGEGQIIASVEFGDCWDGRVDSPDHRAHVVPTVRDQMTGKLACPATHRRMVPKLTQSMAWTIKRADGAVRLSSDHDKKPGTSLHADYMTAWDDATLATAMRNCIDRMLNCSDGDLGDGTIMKRWPGFTYTASPRVVSAPQ